MQLLDELRPDLTIYLKISPEKAFLRKGNEPLDKMEKEGMAFHQKVFEGYEYMVQKDPARFLVVDATLPIEEIHQQIVEKINRLIK